MTTPVREPVRIPYSPSFGFLRWVMRSAVKVVLGDRFHLVGGANIPRRGAVLVCANHISTLDPPLLPMVVGRADTFSMAKSEYFAKPTQALWFRAYQAFPVVRHSPDRTALRLATAILRSGAALCLYPEGTRVTEGGLRQPEAGSGFIALVNHVPVLPIAFVGTRECFPKGARWPRQVTVEARVGQPFWLREKDAAGRRTENAEAAGAIMLSIAELLPPAMRGEFADLEGLGERWRGIRIPADARAIESERRD